MVHHNGKDRLIFSIIDGLRQSLLQGGFEIRQWASNEPTVLKHLPSEARCAGLSQSSTDLQELTLGLHGLASMTPLGYRNRIVEPVQATMRNLYKTLAAIYPLGFIINPSPRGQRLLSRISGKRSDLPS